MLYSETILKGIIETIVTTSFFCYGMMLLFFGWVLISVFDTVDAYRWRRKMLAVLSPEIIGQLQESFTKSVS